MQNRDSNDQIFQFLDSLNIFLIERNKASKEGMSKKAEIGSTWQTPKCKVK